MNERKFDAVLNETFDQFRAQGLNILGEGYREIATNAGLLESYVENLTEGASANDAAQMAALMENANTQLLIESSVTGIAPIASLSMPVIRKLWPKFALKEALKTEVAKTPRFVVAYTKPYLFRGEEKIYLPYREDITDGESNLASRKGKGYIYADILALDAGSAITVDFNEALAGVYTLKDGTGAALTTPLVATTNSLVKKQPLTTDFVVEVDGKRHKLDVTGSVVIPVGAGAQLIVKVDFAEGKALVASIGRKFEYVAAADDTPAKDVLVLRADVSQEFNETSYSLGLEIARLDIDIPVGTHINAPLTVETLNDLLALYQIDGTKEVTEVMTNYLAQELDLEILDFLAESFYNQPGVHEFAGYPESAEYSLSFDLLPAVGFAGSPKAWREELKPQIDYLASKIKKQTYLKSGTFVIVCDPLDANVLTNVDWTFRGGQGGGVDGVDVDYSVGTYVGTHTYKVIASPNVPQGTMFVLFLPSSDNQMTYKYYPYHFSVETGYIDPNRSRVPSLMMTRRHTMREFLPAIGLINIINNDGQGYFRKSIPTTEWK